MTVFNQPPRRPVAFLLIALLVGLVIGLLTLPLQGLLPDGVLQIANSGAVWSVAAFALGWYAPTRRQAIAAGLVALIAEVVGYYTLAALVDLMDIMLGTLAVVAYWLGVALVAGPLFGWAGYAARHASGWPRDIALAALGALFVGEGLHLMMVHPTPHTGILWLAFGIAVTLVLTRGRAGRARVWMLLPALSAVCFGGLRLLVVIDGIRAGIS